MADVLSGPDKTCHAVGTGNEDNDPVQPPAALAVRGRVTKVLTLTLAGVARLR